MIVMELHQDTRTIAALLAEVSFGETITLDTITNAIGRDIKQNRHLLYGAIRVVERDIGAVFCVIRGVGYRRITSDELHKVGQTARARIRSQARRGVRTISNGLAKANDISPDALRGALREQSVLGLLEHSAKEQSQPEMPPDAVRPLPVAEVAKEFLKRMGATQS